MGKARPSPASVVRTLHAALASLEHVQDDADSGIMSSDSATARRMIAVNGYARMLLALDDLERSDKRFDFGVVRDAMLAFLPHLVIGHDLTPLRLGLVSAQLWDIGASIMGVAAPTPKPLDIAGAVAAEELSRKYRDAATAIGIVPTAATAIPDALLDRTPRTVDDLRAAGLPVPSVVPGDAVLVDSRYEHAAGAMVCATDDVREDGGGVCTCNPNGLVTKGCPVHHPA